MILYTVYYKKAWWPFWKKIKRVKGDITFDGSTKQAMPYRTIFLEDETRIEPPYNLILKFSPDRFRSIHKDMEREAGQSISVN